MKLLLVSGGIHEILVGYFSRKTEVVNKDSLQINDLPNFLQEVNPVIEGVVITDEAFSQNIEQDKQGLSTLLEWLKKNQKTSSKVQIITRDFMKEDELELLIKTYPNLSIITYDYLRISKAIISQAFGDLRVEQKQAPSFSAKPERVEEVEKKRSFLDRFRSKPKDKTELQATDRLTREFENVSRGISRIVAITGHRGAGLTSTVVNVACEATKRGLSAIIIDMDIDYRSTNMYFSSFHEMTKKDEDINASLIRTLARPQDYMTTAFNIKDDLWITSLGYGVTDRKLIDQFYNPNKLVGLLSVLRNRFNLVILDMPMDLFKVFRESLIHIDVFGLCVPNNIYSVLSTLRNIEVIFDDEDASYVNAKSKVVVTKYNDRSRFQNDIFVPEKVNEMLTSGLSEKFTYEMKLAGYVPYSNDFDSQVETDVPLVNTSVEHEKAFGNILLRLMEGVK